MDVLPLARIEPPLAAGETAGTATSAESIWVWSSEQMDRVELRGDPCRPGTGVGGAPQLLCSTESIVVVRVPVANPGLYRIRISASPSEHAECFLLSWADGGQRLGLDSLADLETTDGVYEVDAHLSATADQLTLELYGSAALWKRCDLALREIEVTRTATRPGPILERIRALEALDGARHPLAVGGYLLPSPPAESARPPFDEGHSFREGILAAPSQRIEFPLEVPERAQLSLSLGLHRMSRIGAAVRFAVRIDAGDASTTLLEESLVASPAAWHWHERRLDLEPWSGERVNLVLETVAGDGGVAIPVWGKPRIDFPRAVGDPPSVLLLAVDTLRADHLEPYGDRGPRTPAIAALAADGVVFEQGIAEANWTLASFASLFTGASPARHQVRRSLDALPHRMETVASRFRRAGWITEAILYKTVMGPGRDLERGFERYFNVPQVYARGDRNRRKAIEWLSENGDRRFFLFLHFDDPHQPYTQPKEWVPAGTLRTLHRLGLRLPMATNPRELDRSCAPCAGDPAARDAFEEATRSLYDSEIAFVDAQIGKIFDRLRRLGLWDELLIVFVADHGELLWERAVPHRGPRYGHSGEGQPDALVRIPIIIKPPASWPEDRGRRVSRRVSLVDVAATLADLVDENDTLDGRSLLDVVRGTPADRLSHRPMFSFGPFGESMRWGPWHYSRTYADGADLHEWVERIEPPATEGEPASGPLAELRARMADHLVGASTGWVVLALKATPGERFAVSVDAGDACDRGRDPAFPPFGAPWQCREGVWSVAGRAQTSLPVIFGVAARDRRTLSVEAELDGASVARRRVRIEALPEYRPGRLVEWLTETGAPRVLLARTRGDGVSASDRAAAELDDEQIEALRALGYLE